MLRVFGRGLARAQRGLAVMEEGHPRTPHYYLDSLGVEPGVAGEGIGSALMEPVLERCDAERMPAYLNAGSARSRDLYLRHGFEVTEEFRLPDGGPPLWRMWREPRLGPPWQAIPEIGAIGARPVPSGRMQLL